jgi:hypothetical protein
MALKRRYLTLLTPDDVRAVNGVLERLASAHDEYVQAVGMLKPISGLSAETERMAVSARGVVWEREQLNERLHTLLDNGKKHAGCPTCGCRLPADGGACGFCGWVKPAKN